MSNPQDFVPSLKKVLLFKIHLKFTLHCSPQICSYVHLFKDSPKCHKMSPYRIFDYVRIALVTKICQNYVIGAKYE